jgi:hypothetical protein
VTVLFDSIDQIEARFALSSSSASFPGLAANHEQKQRVIRGPPSHERTFDAIHHAALPGAHG